MKINASDIIILKIIGKKIEFFLDQKEFFMEHCVYVPLRKMELLWEN